MALCSLYIIIIIIIKHGARSIHHPAPMMVGTLDQSRASTPNISLARSNDRMMSTSCVAAFHLLFDVIIGRESNGAVGSLAQQRGRETLIEAEDAALGHDAAHRSNEHRPLRLTLCICMVCVRCIHTSQSILSHSIHQSWPIDEIPTAVASCR